MTLALAVGAAACGGSTPESAPPEGAVANAAAAATDEPSAEPAGQSTTAAGFNPAALCDALDTARIASILGAAVQDTESVDRTMMGDPIGYCQVIFEPAHTVRIQVFARADDRFVVNKGGGETVPLLEEPHVRPIPDVGDRAGAIWANADFDNAANNVRGVAVDFGGVAVNVTYVGAGALHSTEQLVQVARQVQADLGL